MNLSPILQEKLKAEVGKYIDDTGLNLTEEGRSELLQRFAETKHLAFVGMGASSASASELDVDVSVVDTLQELDPTTLSAVGHDPISAQQASYLSSPTQYQSLGGKQPKPTAPPITYEEHYGKMKAATREHAADVCRALEGLKLEAKDSHGADVDLGRFKSRRSFKITKIKPVLCARMVPKEKFCENDIDEIATRLRSTVRTFGKDVKRTPSELPVFGLLVNRLGDEYTVWVIGLYVSHNLHLQIRYKSVTARHKPVDSAPKRGWTVDI